MKLFRSTTVLAAAVLSLVAVNAAHAVLHDVKRVRVTQNANQFLSLAEVMVFQAAGLNEAAAANGGIAAQSSTGFGGLASRANDGNTNGIYGGNSVSHNNVTTAGEFWEVTLDAVIDVSMINVFGRSDCCQDRDDNLTLTAFNASGGVVYTQNFGLFPNTPVNVVQGRFSVDFIPEPASAGLLILGLGALLRRRRTA